MKKPHDFRRLSDHICVDCGIRLKLNLVERNPNAKRCYVCNKLASNSMNFRRKAFQIIQRHRKIKNGLI